jgi:UDP-N-acetylmuramoylalanine--D-glutamate ligase
VTAKEANAVITITEFQGRDVAVFGLARTGLSAARALAAGGARVHAWDDSPEARARAEAEGVAVSDIGARDWRGFAALVLSPGVPLTHPKPHRVVELARAVGVPIMGDVELFARAVAALPAPQRPRIVGVTGTNGKSTTTALIAHILKSSGKDARAAGNIGAPVLDLPTLHAGACHVLELSSYQLDLTSSLRCDVAVLLNITPDHLDRHGGMEGYIAAKARIFANQGGGDWAVIGVDAVESAKLCTRMISSGAREVAPVSNAQALGRGVCVLGGKLYDNLASRTEMVGDLGAALALSGRHNWQNAAAAYAAARALGLGRREIFTALLSFPGLAHRLEAAGRIAGVRFINDSKATNADAAAQALAVHPEAYWIAGGVAKEGGVESLAYRFDRLRGAYLIGEAAEAFAATIGETARVRRCGDLKTAVAAAYADARADGACEPVVLLSPACASFDQFADYQARGEAFKRIVAELGDVEAERESAA